MYTKLTNFFPQDYLNELIELCEVGEYQTHGAIPLELLQLNRTK